MSEVNTTATTTTPADVVNALLSETLIRQLGNLVFNLLIFITVSLLIILITRKVLANLVRRGIISYSVRDIVLSIVIYITLFLATVTFISQLIGTYALIIFVIILIFAFVILAYHMLDDFAAFMVISFGKMLRHGKYYTIRSIDGTPIVKGKVREITALNTVFAFGNELIPIRNSILLKSIVIPYEPFITLEVALSSKGISYTEEHVRKLINTIRTKLQESSEVLKAGVTSITVTNINDNTLTLELMFKPAIYPTRDIDLNDCILNLRKELNDLGLEVQNIRLTKYI
ncbi:MAG: hypothetical protein B6U85_05820 [Desulfurococcales archaeon ex4484_42]|nr:MAG: hypothetical protein B6U85_05820 [Desulfurococcales archaeon ex4484_42]